MQQSQSKNYGPFVSVSYCPYPSERGGHFSADITSHIDGVTTISVLACRDTLAEAARDAFAVAPPCWLLSPFTASEGWV